MTPVQSEPRRHSKHLSALGLLKNAVSSMMGTLVVSLIGFLLTPFLIHHLGDERFGVWTLIFSIVAFTELADFGIGQGVQRFAAQYLAHQEHGKIKDLANQAFTLVMMIITAISLPLFILDLLMPVLFKVPAGLAMESQWSMAILILSMILFIPLSVLSGIIIGYQKYDLLNVNWIAFSLVRAVALVGCVFLPVPLIFMAGVLLLLAFVRFISLVSIIKHLCPVYVFRFHWPNAHFFSQVARYGGSLFFISILGRVIYTSDTMMIGLFLNTAAITYYTIGMKWSEIFRLILSGAIQVCFPAFSHLNAIEDYEKTRNILLHGSRLAVGLGILGASLLTLLAEPIIHLWVGDGYKASIPIMRWLGIVGVVTSFLFPFEHYLKAVGHVRPLFKASLFNCIFNILASIILLKAVGLIGAVWGTLAPLIPTALIITIPAACRHAGIPLKRLFRQLLAPLALPICWVILMGLWFHFYPPPLNTFMRTLNWGAIIVGGYLFLWMLLDPLPRRILKLLKPT